MKKHKPLIAPGNDEAWSQDASQEDKQKGNVTRVTTLSYDEVDPSKT
ncbi:hypothetical protein [Desulforamulus ruminis]|uniref:Uncharacterized protein n=1 Tax=Desulforamulus ruminis (strain ATCC 23193 / DSM 2154 / NCIMB 8452 / DL) TaxID=696281 RepID=F6DKR7_DESRL|nr:hypothetical protein [Desulforamulus ruminis]AEG60442.1 hypothetical protein Desru_2193 [Desulforamulus ruminis DSM 2154]